MSANHAGVITAKAPEAREENLTRVLKPIHLWALAAPHFEMARVMAGPMLPNGWDGVMAAVPFACAAKNNPQVSQVALSSHLSREPGMKYALELEGLKAEDVPLQAGLALGEGIGAVLGLTLLKTILYTARHMGRMEEIMGKMAQSC